MSARLAAGLAGLLIVAAEAQALPRFERAAAFTLASNETATVSLFVLADQVGIAGSCRDDLFLRAARFQVDRPLRQRPVGGRGRTRAGRRGGRPRPAGRQQGHGQRRPSATACWRRAYPCTWPPTPSCAEAPSSPPTQPC
jgi:hypothetical protein